MRLFGAKGSRLAVIAALHLLFPIWHGAAHEISAEQPLDLEGVDDSSNYYTELHRCPVSCVGLPPSNWTVYNDYSRLQRCNESMLFDFALYNPVMDPETPTKIRVCTADADQPRDSIHTRRNDSSSESCSRNFAGAGTQTQTKLWLRQTGMQPGSAERDAIATVLGNLQDLFASSEGCTETTMFAYHQNAVAGVYLGKGIDKSTVSTASQSLVAHLGSQEGHTSTTMSTQLCGTKRNAHHVFGLVVDTAGNMTAVQNMVKGWTEGECVEQYESEVELREITIWERQDVIVVADANNRTTTYQNQTVQSTGSSHIAARDECRYIKVVYKDDCGSLASRCGISGNDVTKYNTQPNFCSTLMPGQPICCSAGNLPDLKPKPNSDGTCASYLVVKDDNCSSLAASNGLSRSDIEKFNNGTTWGWYGCDKLLADSYICLSEGRPPLPYPIPNAVCGPLKPGSSPPTAEQQLKDINPCPLNACCNIWGQCGISGAHCTEKKSSSGNPGTSGAKDGCVSSCGTEIVNMNASAKSFGRIGYYESWNFNRSCLHQHVENADKGGNYTIIHWAFAEINTNDWTVKIVDNYKQWDKFKKLTAKKVVSFGGWTFSNLPETYNILRQAMTPANRDTFAANVASFLDKEGLDGVDFDWEYPGATDTGAPPGASPDDGANYLKFLATLKKRLSNKTVSIAAPASYWYLKNFPIEKMATQLDYIVYMTYDLHGQWDVGNEWSIDGCPAGNCLRSHGIVSLHLTVLGGADMPSGEVNLTETVNALAMITKAGVSTNKIYVGESSYGRSFKMAQAGCTGTMCTFLGDRLNSQAKKGRCTDTAGYISNAEISEIISYKEMDPEEGTPGAVDTWTDVQSLSDFMVYEGTEWVAYLTPETKAFRRLAWRTYNFAGTIDWAVDLQEFTTDDFRDFETGQFPSSGDNDGDLPPAPAACTQSFDSIDKLKGAQNISTHCMPIYTIEILAGTLKKSMETYDKLIKSGYDGRFKTYADSVVKGGKKAVRDWMYENGDPYFDCQVPEAQHCCKWCHYVVNDEQGQCKYCDDKYCNGWSTVCEQPDVITCPAQTTGYFNVSGPCPPDYSKRAGPLPTTGFFQSVYWSLEKGREDLFWSKLYEGVGIAKEDIQFQNVQFFDGCTPTSTEDCKYVGWDYGIPVPVGFETNDVVNPKDIVQAAYGNLTNMVKDLPTAVSQLKNGTFQGSATDLADALALPVYMIETAVSNIQQISDKIEEYDKEKRKNIILAFLTAIFFFVPIVGQVASTFASLATIARIIAILGTVGEIATDIYTVVDTKGNDPLAIFSLVLAPLAIFDTVQIAKAASISRKMKSDDIAKLGKDMKGKMDTVKDLNSACRIVKRDMWEDDILRFGQTSSEMGLLLGS